MNEFIKIKEYIINKNDIVFVRFHMGNSNSIKIVIKDNYEIVEYFNDDLGFKAIEKKLTKMLNAETLIEIK